MTSSQLVGGRDLIEIMLKSQRIKSEVLVYDRDMRSYRPLKYHEACFHRQLYEIALSLNLTFFRNQTSTNHLKTIRSPIESIHHACSYTRSSLATHSAKTVTTPLRRQDTEAGQRKHGNRPTLPPSPRSHARAAPPRRAQRYASPCCAHTTAGGATP